MDYIMLTGYMKHDLYYRKVIKIVFKFIIITGDETMAIFILFTSKWQRIKFCLIQKMSIIYYKSPK